jgi:GNAT superfamily N-acetyltransferase
MLRCLDPSDRDRLSDAYDLLSAESRRRRFFSPPKHLSSRFLDYLTDLDNNDRFAWVAFEPSQPDVGLGLARWVRSEEDPTRAEPAVAVLDAWQGRGLGTALLLALIETAQRKGITTFVAEVLWENDTILDPLRALGARVSPVEPGIALVEFDLPDRLDGTALHEMLSRAASAG